MIFSVGSPKNIIEFPLSGLEILQGRKLDPEFLRNLLESPDTLADQLARPVILGVDVTFDEDLFLLIEKTPVLLIILRENNNLHGSHQILQCHKGHGLSGPRVLDGFRRDHTADDLPGLVLHLALVRLLIELEIAGQGRNVFPPHGLVFFQRMAADIDAQNFFFKRKELFLLVLTHVRQVDFKLLFLLLAHEIKEAHLTGKAVFPLLGHLIHE